MPCERLHHPSNRSVAIATSGLRQEPALIPEKKLLLDSVSIQKHFQSETFFSARRLANPAVQLSKMKDVHMAH